MRLLGDKVLLKKYSVTEVDKGSGMEFKNDGESLPRAEVILVSAEVEDYVQVGDHAYYIEPREKGRCKYNGEEHFIVPLSALIAVI